MTVGKKIPGATGMLGTMLVLFIAMAGCQSVTSNGTDTTPVSVFTVFTTDDGLSDNYITDMVYDHTRNGLWCATFNSVSFYSTADSSWTVFSASSGIPHLETTSIAMDLLTGSVLLGTVSGPAVYSGSEWSILSDADSLLHRQVTAVATANDGYIWYGTKAGVSRRGPGGNWKHFTVANLLPASHVTAVYPVFPDEVWVGTISGLWHGGSDDPDVFTGSDLPSPYVSALYHGTGEFEGVWVGTANGVTVYDGQNWQRYGTYDGLPSPAANDFAQDSNGVLWVATNGGAAYYSGGAFKAFDLPAAVRNERILCLAADIITGDIWFGTSNGLVRYETAKEK